MSEVNIITCSRINGSQRLGRGDEGGGDGDGGGGAAVEAAMAVVVAAGWRVGGCAAEMKAMAMEMVEVVRLLELRCQWWLRRLGDEGDDDGAWRRLLPQRGGVVVMWCRGYGGDDGGLGVEREATAGGRKLARGGGAAPEKVREHVYSIKYLLGQSTKDTIVQTARNPSAAGIVFSVDLFIIGLQLNHVPMSLPGIIIPFANDLKAEIGPFGQQEYGTNIAAWTSEILRNLHSLHVYVRYNCCLLCAFGTKDQGKDAGANLVFVQDATDSLNVVFKMVEVEQEYNTKE
ncbi:hypothetical protein Tco_0265876 [Tanacetum coccineum]